MQSFLSSVDLFIYLYFPFHITFHIPTVTEMGWNNVSTALHFKRFAYMDSFFCIKNFFFFLKAVKVIILLPQICVNLMYTLNEWIFQCMFV